jgi:hypothetical protein
LPIISFKYFSPFASLKCSISLQSKMYKSMCFVLHLCSFIMSLNVAFVKTFTP